MFFYPNIAIYLVTSFLLHFCKSKLASCISLANTHKGVFWFYDYCLLKDGYHNTHHLMFCQQ